MYAALTVCLIALEVTTVGCIHRSTGQVTPWERVHTYNAALAEANNAVEQGAEGAVLAGALTVQQAAPIINWTGQVAIVHQQVTAVLGQGSATAQNIASIRAMVGEIKASLASLPPAAVGLKNPRTQQTFQADVANIGVLADALLAAVEAVGGGN